MSPLQTELAHVERLVTALSRDVKSAERTVARERKDVENARHPGWGWRGRGYSGPDEDDIASEAAELADAEAHASIAGELAVIARARAETLRARVAGGGTTCDDTATLVEDLRHAIDEADAAAADAHDEALGAVLAGGDTTSTHFVRAGRALARTRIQLDLLVANLVASRGDSDPTVGSLAAFEFKASGHAPNERWRKQVAAECAHLREALAPLATLNAYR